MRHENGVRVGFGCALALGLWAQAGAGGSTASFLKIPVGAREVGMGQAFTALASGADAAFWNPAGLTRLQGREVTATDARVFADVRFDTLAYAHPLGAGGAGGAGPSGTLGVSVGYLGRDRVESRGADRQPTGSYGASDMVVGVSYGRPWGGLRVGGTLKYVRSSIAEQSASGAAADFGVQMPTRVSGLTVGAALQNLGPGIRFIEERDPLPMTLSLGAGWQMPLGLTVTGEVKRQFADQRTSASVGMELPLLPAVTARAGYLRTAGSTPASSPSSLPVGFAGGIGLRLFRYSLDYAFTPAGELGSAQRISLTARF